MRKITERIRMAWKAGKKLSVDNTMTDGNSVWLFGNKIIKVEGGKVYATYAEYPTRTTSERLNGITVGWFAVRKEQAYFDGMPIENDEWVLVGSK